MAVRGAGGTPRSNGSLPLLLLLLLRTQHRCSICALESVADEGHRTSFDLRMRDSTQQNASLMSCSHDGTDRRTIRCCIRCCVRRPTMRVCARGMSDVCPPDGICRTERRTIRRTVPSCEHYIIYEPDFGARSERVVRNSADQCLSKREHAQWSPRRRIAAALCIQMAHKEGPSSSSRLHSNR